MIETVNLSKIYPGGGGCRDISLEVGEREVFGLLGPNGAGKSTFVKMLLGLLEPTSGSARILGRPLGDVAIRRELSFLPENFAYHQWMTAGEVLQFHGALCGISPREIRERTLQVLDKVKLSGKEGQRISTFSKGMQQRLGLAVALINRPRLIFLDEPTSALDPIGRKHVRELIQQLSWEGTTIFLNSHLLSEVEMVCDRVAIIKGGAMVAEGTLDQLLRVEIQVEVTMGSPDSSVLQRAREICTNVEMEGNNLIASLERENLIPQFVGSLVEAGAQIYSVSPRKQTLEELFVRLIGEGAEPNA